MKVKDVKNGDEVTTRRLGKIVVENALYIRVNAIKAGQGDVKLADWLDSHPHADKVKDTDLTPEWLKANVL